MTTKYPPSRQLMAELAKGKTSHVYLLLGEEEGEKDRAIDLIRRISLPGDDDRRNYSGIFHGENDELKGAAEFALSSAMFGPGRVCVIRNIDGVKNTADSMTLLKELLETLPDSTTLVMTSTKTSAPAFLKGGDGMAVYQFWKAFDRDLVTYIRSTLKKDGMGIDEEAIAVLLERTGSDMRRIDDALDLLRSGYGGHSFDGDMVRSLVEDFRESSVFRFIDLLFLKRRRAVNELKRLLDEGTAELLILNRIAHQAEMLETYHRRLTDGASRDDALKAAGVLPRKQQEFIESAELFPPDSVRRIFPLLARTDRDLKSGHTSGELAANPVFSLTASILSL